jgi:hypothetical protein
MSGTPLLQYRRQKEMISFRERKPAFAWHAAQERVFKDRGCPSMYSDIQGGITDWRRDDTARINCREQESDKTQDVNERKPEAVSEYKAATSAIDLEETKRSITFQFSIVVIEVLKRVSSYAH